MGKIDYVNCNFMYFMCVNLGIILMWSKDLEKTNLAQRSNGVIGKVFFWCLMRRSCYNVM